MKTFITRNADAKFGYQINFDGKILDVLDIVDDGKTLKLPDNPSNRKYFSIAKVEAAGGEIELTYKETKTFGPRTTTSTTPKTTTRGIEEYLEGEDKELYLQLVKKAMDNKAKMVLRAQIEALKKEYQAKYGN